MKILDFNLKEVKDTHTVEKERKEEIKYKFNQLETDFMETNQKQTLKINELCTQVGLLTQSEKKNKILYDELFEEKLDLQKKYDAIFKDLQNKEQQIFLLEMDLNSLRGKFETLEKVHFDSRN